MRLPSIDAVRRLPPLPRRKEVLIALVILAVVAGYVILAHVPQHRRVNWGFGPDWDCANAGKGEPICIKRPSASGAPSERGAAKSAEH